MCVGAVCKFDVHDGNMIDNRARNGSDHEKNRGDEQQERADVMKEIADTHFDSVVGSRLECFNNGLKMEG
jgi:hypothetical protein